MIIYHKSYTCVINFKDLTGQTRHKAPKTQEQINMLRGGGEIINSSNLRKYIKFLVQTIAKIHLELSYA